MKVSIMFYMLLPCRYHHFISLLCFCYTWILRCFCIYELVNSPYQAPQSLIKRLNDLWGMELWRISSNSFFWWDEWRWKLSYTLNYISKGIQSIHEWDILSAIPIQPIHFKHQLYIIRWSKVTIVYPRIIQSWFHRIHWWVYLHTFGIEM